MSEETFTPPEEKLTDVAENANEPEADMYVSVRNLLCSAILGMLKYIAVVFPRFLFYWTLRLFPTTMRLLGKAIIILVLLAVLAFLLGWPYAYWFVYHANDSKELYTIIEISWLLLIGIPGVYLGIRSRGKWIARWKAWRKRRLSSKHEMQTTGEQKASENQP